MPIVPLLGLFVIYTWIVFEASGWCCGGRDVVVGRGAGDLRNPSPTQRLELVTVLEDRPGSELCPHAADADLISMQI